jgi:predicted DNA-binding protein
MARQKAEGKRYFVRLSDEHKRRLDFLAVDRGAESTEAFGGKLLAEAIDHLWQNFDPKKPRRAGK